MTATVLNTQKMSLLSRRELLDTATRIMALAAWPGCAAADDYPSRPIRLVIPYTAGAAGDQIGRPWADRITSLLGPIYVENIGGAGGAIGSAAVAQSAPDGYSLLLGNGSTQVMIPLSSAQPAYDTVRDFRAVYRLITSTLAFAVHPSLPVKDLRELAAFAKANPGRLSYGTPGVGTGNHLIGEMFRQQSGVAADLVHVPYRGMGPATNDLVSGQISSVVAVVSSQILQLHHAGKLRLIAVTSDRRAERRAGHSDGDRIRHAGPQICRLVRLVRSKSDPGCDRGADRCCDPYCDGRSTVAGKLSFARSGAGRRFRSRQVSAPGRGRAGPTGSHREVDRAQARLRSRLARLLTS
ncbi:tripartite-type tricarboxylate transporter receptor subunit TctC [Bradyrhizobium ottawaense]